MKFCSDWTDSGRFSAPHIYSRNVVDSTWSIVNWLSQEAHSLLKRTYRNATSKQTPVGIHSFPSSSPVANVRRVETGRRLCDVPSSTALRFFRLFPTQEKRIQEAIENWPLNPASPAAELVLSIFFVFFFLTGWGLEDLQKSDEVQDWVLVMLKILGIDEDQAWNSIPEADIKPKCLVLERMNGFLKCWFKTTQQDSVMFLNHQV